LGIKYSKSEHQEKYLNMKTKEKKGKSVIQQLRDIRDNISLEIQNMTFEQLTEYLKNKKSLHPTMAKKTKG